MEFELKRDSCRYVAATQRIFFHAYAANRFHGFVVTASAIREVLGPDAGGAELVRMVRDRWPVFSAAAAAAMSETHHLLDDVEITKRHLKAAASALK